MGLEHVGLAKVAVEEVDHEFAEKLDRIADSADVLKVHLALGLAHVLVVVAREVAVGRHQAQQQEYNEYHDENTEQGLQSPLKDIFSHVTTLYIGTAASQPAFLLSSCS